jgi:nitrate/TMAO reductase-like tetraheme cytochrome c subunit
VAVVTAANLVIGSQLTYRAVTYMDTDAFCGQACHKVMMPEYTSYLNSSHARVACAECHIGAGASFYVKSKLAGVGQLVAVTFDTYPRPIPHPVENLRPARETCEQCHWPQRFEGNKFFVHTEYASDEQNSATTNVALVKIGGSNFTGGVGIHGAHVGTRGQMEYIALDHRQTIPQVTYTDSNGKATVFKATDVKVKPEDLAKGERRGMDCMDCHNRPTHAFQLPERALDAAMTQGSISPKLPFIKKEALLALRHDYPDRETAAREISVFLENFYRSGYPQILASNEASLRNAIGAVQSIYARNIFPEMKITWGTYPNNIGHTDFPGCFRCHDGNHTSADGRTISNDCATCHDLVAVGEKNPKILAEIGMTQPTQGSAGGATDK